MRSRTSTVLITVVLLATLSGCSFLGGSGDACGPGDTEVQDVEMGSQVSITGEVTETGPGSYVVDDGTGEAFVMSGEHGVSVGDCVTVEGIGNALPDNQPTDVAIAPETVTLE